MTPIFLRHLFKAPGLARNQVVRQMHEEWFVTHGRTRAKHGVAETQGFALANVNTGNVGRNDIANRRK